MNRFRIAFGEQVSSSGPTLVWGIPGHLAQFAINLFHASSCKFTQIHTTDTANWCNFTYFAVFICQSLLTSPDAIVSVIMITSIALAAPVI